MEEHKGEVGFSRPRHNHTSNHAVPPSRSRVLALAPPPRSHPRAVFPPLASDGQEVVQSQVWVQEPRVEKAASEGEQSVVEGGGDSAVVYRAQGRWPRKGISRV
jgi:hypothetical protein